MYRRTKDNHTVNVAAIMVAAFGYAKFHSLAAFVPPAKTFRGHSQGRLPKGFTDHNPVGAKLTRMAAGKTLTKKGSDRNG